MGLQTYLTAGPKEARAWTLRKGATAPEAAGVIHANFQRRFIKAEVVGYDDLIAAGSATEPGTVVGMRTSRILSSSQCATTTEPTAGPGTAAAVLSCSSGPVGVLVRASCSPRPVEVEAAHQPLEARSGPAEFVDSIDGHIIWC